MVSVSVIIQLLDPPVTCAVNQDNQTQKAFIIRYSYYISNTYMKAFNCIFLN